MHKLSKILDLQNKVAGVNLRNRMLVYAENKRKDFILADDKILTKALLLKHNIPVPETYGIIERIGDIDKQWAELQKHESLAMKPSKGKGGGGILVLNKIDENNWVSPSGNKKSNTEIKRQIADILFGVYSFGTSDRVLVEYCVNSPSFFTDIFPEGVPDVRIISHKERLMLGMLRIPTRESDGKANLHQGALGVDVDLKTGILGKAYNYEGYLSNHPDTKEAIEGKKVPHWEKIIQMSNEISKISPLKYIGVDIVLDVKRGPLVMELNVRPGIEIQNVTKQGIVEIINNFDEI